MANSGWLYELETVGANVATIEKYLLVSSSFFFKAVIATACVIPQSLLFAITSMAENISGTS